MRLPFSRAKIATEEQAPRPRGDGGAAADDSLVQVARTRARRRLVGALVLLAAGVLGFPILFETQPRPLPVDTPIIVPAGTATRAPSTPATPTTRSLPALPPDAGTESVAAMSPVPSAAPAPAPATTPPTAVAPAPTPASSAAAVLAAVPTPRPTAPLAKASAPASVSKPVPVPAAARPEVKVPVPRPASAAAPEPATAAAAADEARFVVQVGAYNDAERMRAARQKLEKLGYKTYTQEIDTPTGKRTRVRVGPFAGRAEAEAVASKVKASGMQANILSL